MFKLASKLLITFLLFLLLITNNSLAFHETNSLKKQVNTEWDEAKSKRQFCATKTKANAYENLKIDQNTGQPAIDENSGDPVTETVFKIDISGYHMIQPIKIEKNKIYPKPLNGLNFKRDDNWSKLKFLEFLKILCLQDSLMGRPETFKDSYLEGFYKEVAVDNGFIDKNGDADYNIKIYEGLLGKDILKKGITIHNPNAVYYIPDYLFQSYDKLKKDKKEADKIQKEKEEKERKAKLKKQREDALTKGNAAWLSENKGIWIGKFKKKLNEYVKIIDQLHKSRSQLTDKLTSYEKTINEVSKKLGQAFQIVDPTIKEVKAQKKELLKNQDEYLSDTTLKEFTRLFEKIKKKNFEGYANYQSLENIIEKANNSKSAKDFVGKEGYTIKWFKKTRQITSDKIGLIKQFEDLEDKPLGSGSDIDADNMKDLLRQITEEIDNIDTYITIPIDEMLALDEELSSQIPYEKYAIYTVVFLVLVAGGFFIFFQSRKIDNLSEGSKSADKKFEELEDQLKDTSEHIKQAKRTSTRGQPTFSTQEEEPVVEKPKTQEAIYIAKYEELLSDYKDSLDDFTKVAGFKQKWNGLALSRKERQDGTKTILINSNRAFEKCEIWCVNYSDKYFAFPGATVRSNMAEPAVIRRGGAGFVVDRQGKLIFPD